MKNSHGLPLEKPVSFWLRTLKVDFKDLFINLNKAVLNVTIQNYTGLLSNFADSLKSFEVKKNAEQMAWLLIYRSIGRAMGLLTKDRFPLILEATKGFTFLANKVEFNEKNLEEIVARLNYAVEVRELVVEESFFDNPKLFPVIHDLKEPFAGWLEGFGLNTSVAKSVSECLPSYFVFALNTEWRNHHENYDLVATKYSTPFTKAAIKEQEWNYYHSYLQKKIDEPLFDEAYSLKQIFIPLRAYSEEKKKKIPKATYEQIPTDYSQWQKENQRIDFEIIRTVFDLNNELDKWIDNPSIKESIRFISGGPGYGKSTVAKIFAFNQIEKNHRKVLFIPLNRFKLVNPNENLSDALKKFVEDEEFSALGDLLDSKNGESRLLLIFDGLDEIEIQGKFGKEFAKQFIEMVQRKVEVSNRNEPRLKVLICGRDISVQNIESQVSTIGIIHLLPYFVQVNSFENTFVDLLNENNEDLTGEVTYKDDGHLLEVDQRNTWWRNYGSIIGKRFEEIPEELNTGILLEITSLPLLNYLIALNYKFGSIDFIKNNNINVIYEKLLELVYERKGIWAETQHRILEEISRDDFFNIFEEIALVAWKNGNLRKVTVEQIENHCLTCNLGHLLEKFKERTKDGALSLLIAFYFRKSNLRGIGLKETFEFTHKSFCEYLVAKKIISAVKNINENMAINQRFPDKGLNIIKALVQWIEICGSNQLDEYLLQYINNEIALEFQKSKELVIKWQETFDSLFIYALNYGMPMNYLPERQLTFKEEIYQAKNAEETLLAVLNAFKAKTERSSKIEEASRESINEWILWNRRGLAGHFLANLRRTKTLNINA